jgi:hypothetical protein
MLSVQQKATRRMTISRDMRRSRVVVAPGMRRRQKSDSPIVAGKPPNEAARVVEEGVERKGGRSAMTVPTATP